MLKPNWPCGHPRTPDNTKQHGTRNGKPIYRCRICRQAIENKAQINKRRLAISEPRA